MTVNNMYDYQEGAKIKSVRANCKKSVPATFKNETVSLCEGLEEIENVLLVICDECGSMTAVPAESLPPLQDAFKRLVKSKAVSRYGEITIELKSQVDAKKDSERNSESDYQHEYPLRATG